MINIQAENAKKIYEWIVKRNGIAVWNSIDLSDPGFQLITPATKEDGSPYEKPHWKVGKDPKIINDINKIEVSFDKEIKRFHVATRIGGNGLNIKCSDGATRRINKEIEKAGEGAYYQFDCFSYENCIIMAPEKKTSLVNWIKENS